MRPVHRKSSSPEETFSIGQKLGRHLGKGRVVCLYGEVGAGKTTMIKGIASAFGISDRDVTSASFTIITQYRTGPRFNHIDLYRVTGSREVFETGVYDALDGESVSVIEWAERLPEVPVDAIRVYFTIVSDSQREIRIEGIDEKDRDHL
ncbi:MAG: tRNA (adenosine(37)-N6)-threonylcarbamoyltransferase complex ATPase subunit type 1 TsaE [bacterium]